MAFPEGIYGSSVREKIFNALADPTRRAIFNLLINESLSVKVLSAEMPVSQPAVSQHLKVLKKAGLISERREGRVHMYFVNPDSLDWMSWMFGTLRDNALDNSGEPKSGALAYDYVEYDAVDKAMEQWAVVWPEHDSLSVGLLVRLRLIARGLEQLSERAAERCGLQSVQLLLLATLDRLSPHESTLTELSKVSFMSLPATARHLDRTEQLGLIQRYPDVNDGRSNRIGITEEGRRVMRQIMRSQRDLEHAAVYQMPLDDKVRLAKLLRPVLRNLRLSLNVPAQESKADS